MGERLFPLKYIRDKICPYGGTGRNQKKDNASVLFASILYYKEGSLQHKKAGGTEKLHEIWAAAGKEPDFSCWF